jgi:hypothetical protein
MDSEGKPGPPKGVPSHVKIVIIAFLLIIVIVASVSDVISWRWMAVEKLQLSGINPRFPAVEGPTFPTEERQHGPGVMKIDMQQAPDVPFSALLRVVQTNGLMVRMRFDPEEEDLEKAKAGNHEAHVGAIDILPARMTIINDRFNEFWDNQFWDREERKEVSLPTDLGCPLTQNPKEPA